MVRTMWVGGLRLVGICANFVFALLLARGLGPGEYGRFTAITAAGQVALALSDLGLGTTAMRKLPVSEVLEGRRIAGALLTIRMAGLLLGCASLIAWLGSLGLTGESLLAGLAWTFVIVPLSVNQLSSQVLVGRGRALAGAALHTAAPVSMAAMAFVALASTRSSALVAVSALVALTLLVAASIASRLVHYAFVLAYIRGHARALVGASLPVALGGLMAVVALRFGSLVLAHTHQDIELGNYSVALGLLSSGGYLASSVAILALPDLARGQFNSETAARRVGVTAFASASLIAAGGAGFMAADGDRLTTLLFGGQYSQAGHLVRALSVSLGLQTVGAVATASLFARGLGHVYLRGSAMTLAIVIPLSVLLVPAAGAAGAVVATIAGDSASTAYFLWHSRRELLGHSRRLLSATATLLCICTVVGGARQAGYPVVLTAPAALFLWIAAVVVVRRMTKP